MLKAIVKQIVGESDWAILSWCRSRFGFFRALLTYWSLQVNKGVYAVPDISTGNSIFLRRGSKDQDVFEKIFIAKEYDIDLGCPLFIVDAGAYTGLSSIFFACKYPNATVVALEPEPSNFSMLLLNTKHYGNIKPIKAGLWSRNAFLRIQDTFASTWAFRVMEDPTGQGIEAIGIPDVMSRFSVTQIDILKMDIEGSEIEVLAQCSSWINSVRTMIIELHDCLRPGCANALEKALGGVSHKKSFSGENVIITNLGSIEA
jgi:FkbM family methyltransferase